MFSTYTDGYRSGSNHRRGANSVPQSTSSRLLLECLVVDLGYTPVLFDETDGDRGEARGCHFLVYSNLSCVDRFGISLPFVLMLRYRPSMSCSVKEFCPCVQ